MLSPPAPPVLPRERKVIPILNPYTREVVAVPPLREEPELPFPQAPVQPFTALEPSHVAVPSQHISPVPETLTRKADEVAPGLNIISMSSNISDALAMLKGAAGSDGGLNLDLYDLDPADLLPPVKEEVKEDSPVASPVASPSLPPAVAPTQVAELPPKPSSFTEEPVPKEKVVEEKKSEPIPAPAAPQSIPSPKLPPAKPKPSAPPPSLPPTTTPEDLAPPPKPLDPTVPKPPAFRARGWEKSSDQSPPLAASAPPAPVPTPKPAAEAKPSWADVSDEEEGVGLPAPAPTGPMTLADRLRISGAQTKSKRAAEIQEMQRKEQERIRYREAEKDRALAAEAAQQEQARRIAAAQKAAAAAPVVRPVAPAAAPVFYTSKPEPAKKEPAPGEWGVAMSKKTRVLAMKAAPDAPLFKAEQYSPPKPEKRDDKPKKEKKEKAEVIQVKLGEEQLKPYKNKVRNLQKKLRELELLESTASRTEEQTAKLARKAQVQKELTDAEQDLARVTGA